MKILSFNIRGAGSRVKSKEVRDLINKLGHAICCLQETKLENVTDAMARNLWGEGSFGWVARNSVGRSGGIMILWNSENFVVSSSWHMEGGVILNGFWGPERVSFCIVNVYAPCPFEERVELWDRLLYVVHQNNTGGLCIVSDFNSIKHPSERSDSSTSVVRRDLESFNNFIRDANLLTFPFMVGNSCGTCRTEDARVD